jgi:hypothetical protein
MHELQDRRYQQYHPEDGYGRQRGDDGNAMALQPAMISTTPSASSQPQ